MSILSAVFITFTDLSSGPTEISRLGTVAVLSTIFIALATLRRNLTAPLSADLLSSALPVQLAGGILRKD